MDVLEQLAEMLDSRMRGELIRQGHRVTGALFDSVKSVVNQTMLGWEIVGNAVVYARWVEEGRRPGAKGVPIEALIEWIRQGKKQLPGMSERSQAFMFMQSIKRKGIKPSHFIATTLEEMSDVIDERITEACGQMVDTFMEQMFNDLVAA